MRKLGLILISALIIIFSASCKNFSDMLAADVAEELEQEQLQDAFAPEEPETPYFGVGYYTKMPFNPVTSTSSINAALISLMYEGLFLIDNDFNAVPTLASSVSHSGNVYTINLKSRITFHSGSAVTANDVVFSLNLAKNTPTSPYYERMTLVSDIRAINSSTVQITLVRNHSEFEKLLDIPIIQSGTENAEFPSGTGPYMVAYDNGAYLAPNKSWHGGSMFTLERVDIVPITADDAHLYSFDTGSISINRSMRIDVDPISFKGDVLINKVPTTQMHYLAVNFNEYPYTDAKVRRALSLMIDRESITETQLQDFAKPAVLPKSYHTDEEILASHNIEEALVLLSEVGIFDSDSDGFLDMPTSDGGRAVFAPSILVNSDNQYKTAAADRIALSLNANGIPATVNKQSYETVMSAISAGQFTIYYGETTLNNDFDVSPLISTGSLLNYGRYTSATMDLTVYALQSASSETLTQKKDEFYNLFSLEMPIIPIAFEYMQVALDPDYSQNIQSLPYNITNGFAN